MKEKEQGKNQEHEELEQHSLICNNELFNKDLYAIVDDTMQEES
ncbi:hypothetical protein [Peribacillus sp. SI8-4]|nr:hypothetical protein [Peribacillus sp. SI8-4]